MSVFLRSCVHFCLWFAIDSAPTEDRVIRIPIRRYNRKHNPSLVVHNKLNSDEMAALNDYGDQNDVTGPRADNIISGGGDKLLVESDDSRFNTNNSNDNAKTKEKSSKSKSRTVSKSPASPSPSGSETDSEAPCSTKKKGVKRPRSPSPSTSPS